jgi:hypothetical protein
VRSLGPALRALGGLGQHDGEHAVVIGCLHVVTPDVRDHRHLQAELPVQDPGEVIGGGARGHRTAALAGDRQVVGEESDVNVLLAHAGQLGLHDQGLLGLIDVGGRLPAAGDPRGRADHQLLHELVHLLDLFEHVRTGAMGDVPVA